MSLVGVATTSLWTWYEHRRAYFAKSIKEGASSDEESTKEEYTPKKPEPGTLVEERLTLFTFIKTASAVIVFMIIYLILITYMYFIVWGMTFMPEVEHPEALYILTIATGSLGVFAGLSAIKLLFSSVRRRRVAWFLIGTLSLFWGFQLILLFVDLIWRSDVPPRFWTATSSPHFVQAIAAALLAWKMTAADGDVESETQTET